MYSPGIHRLSRLYRRYVKGENYYSHGNILLDQAKLIYFPIPKVACSSIKKIFADLLGLRYDPDDVDDSVHEVDFPYVRRSRLADPRYDDYLKFAFVRNPWDRLYSSYRSKVCPDTSTYIRGFTDGVFDGFYKYGCFHAGMSFAAFVEAVCQIPDEEADEHFRSQYVTLVDDHDEFITNFVGRLEAVDKDWGCVAERLPAGTELPHLMRSQRHSYLDVYDAHLIQLVETRYAKDIALFDYTFE